MTGVAPAVNAGNRWTDLDVQLVSQSLGVLQYGGGNSGTDVEDLSIGLLTGGYQPISVGNVKHVHVNPETSGRDNHLQYAALSSNI